MDFLNEWRDFVEARTEVINEGRITLPPELEEVVKDGLAFIAQKHLDFLDKRNSNEKIRDPSTPEEIKNEHGMLAFAANEAIRAILKEILPDLFDEKTEEDSEDFEWMINMGIVEKTRDGFRSSSPFYNITFDGHQMKLLVDVHEAYYDEVELVFTTVYIDDGEQEIVEYFRDSIEIKDAKSFDVEKIESWKHVQQHIEEVAENTNYSLDYKREARADEEMFFKKLLRPLDQNHLNLLLYEFDNLNYKGTQIPFNNTLIVGFETFVNNKLASSAEPAAAYYGASRYYIAIGYHNPENAHRYSQSQIKEYFQQYESSIEHELIHFMQDVMKKNQKKTHRPTAGGKKGDKLEKGAYWTAGIPTKRPDNKR
jgi:hypothetical protein